MSEYKPPVSDKRPDIDTGYVSKLLADVFGIESPVFIPGYLKRTGKAPSYTDVKEENRPNGLASPYAGVEVKSPGPDYDNAPVRFGQKTFGTFWFESDTYKTWDDYKGKLTDVTLKKLLMPLASLVNFSRSKNITKTPMLGGRGSIKEIYSLQDWSISINGIILPDSLNPLTQQSVTEQQEAIQQFNEVAGSIKVAGQLFEQRNISRIVIESLSFSPVRGKPGMMQYKIEAVSDGDLLLTDAIE